MFNATVGGVEGRKKSHRNERKSVLVEVVAVEVSGDRDDTVVQCGHVDEVPGLDHLPLNVHLPQLVRPEVRAGRRDSPLKHPARTQPDNARERLVFLASNVSDPGQNTTHFTRSIFSVPDKPSHCSLSLLSRSVFVPHHAAQPLEPNQMQTAKLPAEL